VPEPSAPSTTPFSYLILRVVPSVERGERLNVGVVLFCRQRDFLRARVAVDERRLGALLGDEPPVRDVAEHLASLVAVAAGEAGAGPIAELPPSERFGWLAAPSSTVVQPSEVHTGLCEDPERELQDLFAKLVG
jgi:hypothetical protein